MNPSDLLRLDLTEIDDKHEELLAALVDSACRNLSTFLIEDRTLSSTLISQIKRTALDFFCLQKEDKLALHRPGSGIGYIPEKVENLAATIGLTAPPDPKETFNIGPDPSRNRWPQSPPSIEEVFRLYYSEMWRLSKKLMRVLSRALGVPPTFLDDQSLRGNSILRATRYPKIEPETGGILPLRAGAHTDYGLFSLLLLDGEVGGFQVKPPQYDWIDIQADANMFVINIGDLLSLWTNKIWPATLHRVQTPAEFAIHDRLSVVFLHNPNPDALITPLPRFTPETKSQLRPEPVVAGEYLKSKSKLGFGQSGEPYGERIS